MDYIREINAFYDNDMPNHLSSSAAHLYLALLNIANRLFWREGFMASDVLLMARAGIKDRRTLRRAMEELSKTGLIESARAARGTTYTIKGLCGAKNAASNARRQNIPGNLAALNAEKNVVFNKSAAKDAALNAEKNVVFNKSAAKDATSNADHDSDEAANSGGSGSAQTKLNKQTETKQTKQTRELTTAEAVGEQGVVNNKELIAELVAAFRETPGIESSKGDYPFIGALYNEYGYEQVFYGIHELCLAAANSKIEKPLIYLRAILIRQRPDRPLRRKENKESKENREEDSSAKYERERYRG